MSRSEELTRKVWLKSNAAVNGVNLYFLFNGTGAPVAVQTVNLTTAWQQFTLVGAGASDTTQVTVQFGGNNTLVGTTELHIWHPDLRTSADASLSIPSYQRVTSSSNYDSAGFPVYLATNGTNQYLVSSATNGSVGTALVALSPAAVANQTPMASGGQAAAEAGVGIKLRSNGQVWATKSDGASVISATTTATFSAGQSFVAGNVWDTTQAIAHLNNQPGSPYSSAINAASSNVFHLGRADSASSIFEYFQGRIYGAIVVNAAVDATSLARTKTWLGQRMGIAL